MLYLKYMYTHKGYLKPIHSILLYMTNMHIYIYIYIYIYICIATLSRILLVNVLILNFPLFLIGASLSEPALPCEVNSEICLLACLLVCLSKSIMWLHCKPNYIKHVINMLSKPHHVRSTVRSVFLLACFSKPIMWLKCIHQACDQHEITYICTS